MPVVIEPVRAKRLRVTGDLAMELATPFDRFHLAFSDGTLVAGEYDPREKAFLYIVETEGAGLVRTTGDRRSSTGTSSG